MDIEVFEKQMSNLKAVFKGFNDDYVKLILEIYGHLDNDTFTRAVDILLKSHDKTPTIRSFEDAVVKAVKYKPKIISQTILYDCPLCLDSGYLTMVMHSDKYNKDYEYTTSCINDICNNKLKNNYPVIKDDIKFKDDTLKFVGYRKKFQQYVNGEKAEDFFIITRDENLIWRWKCIK